MVNTKPNIGILFGGKSPEHEVSIITGIQVLTNIDKEKYNPIPIYVSKSGNWYYSLEFFDIQIFKNLDYIPYVSKEVVIYPTPKEVYLISKKPSLFRKGTKINIDVFFPCFHGSLGENGAFQGLFEICEKPYVGSEILGSALGMDKVLAKQVLEANNILSAPYSFYSKTRLIENIDEVVSELQSKFKYPMFVKPAVGGSSVGISKVHNLEELKEGLELASVFDTKVLIEQGIENAKEINISVIGNTGSDLLVSACEEVFHKGDFLTYEDKYKGGDGKSMGMASTKRKIPAELSANALEAIKNTAKKVFNALNCFGLARIDFLVKENPLEIYVIEVNTIPGSMAFYLWEESGVNFKELISKLIEYSIIRCKEKSTSTTTFSSDILKDFKPGLKSPKLK